MENQPGSLGAMFDNAGDYLETRIELLKLQAINKSSDLSSSLVSRLAIVIVLVFALLFLNIGIAVWIGEALDQLFLGFIILAAFYGILALLLHLFRKSWIKDPVSNMLIKKMLN